MPDDYFEDSPGNDAPMQDGQKEGTDHQDEGGGTFLINKEVCPDMKSGDTMTLRVVEAHDGEYSVQYVPEEKEEQREEQPEEAAMPSGMGAEGGGDSMYD